MKKVFLFVAGPLLFLCACGVTEPSLSRPSMDASVNIEVECRNDQATRSMVLGLLRRAKARDVRETVDANTLEIKSSYYLYDNAPQRLEEIGNLLTMQVGVYHVEILENRAVIKDPR